MPYRVRAPSIRPAYTGSGATGGLPASVFNGPDVRHWQQSASDTVVAVSSWVIHSDFGLRVSCTRRARPLDQSPIDAGFAYADSAVFAAPARRGVAEVRLWHRRSWEQAPPRRPPGGRGRSR